MGFLLFALSPPSNVARAVREVQERLYARWGLISPLALPPLLPLTFAAPPAGKDAEVAAPPGTAKAPPPAGKDAEVAAPPGMAKAPPSPVDPAEILRLAAELQSRLRGGQALRAPRLKTGGFAVEQDTLFWELDGNPAPLRELVRTLSPWPALEPPPFRPAQGFFLALAEPGVDPAQAARELAVPPPVDFPASALVLLAVRCLHPEPLQPFTEPLPAPPWYRALEWEELIRIPLKKPAQDLS